MALVFGELISVVNSRPFFHFCQNKYPIEPKHAKKFIFH